MEALKHHDSAKSQASRLGGQHRLTHLTEKNNPEHIATRRLVSQPGREAGQKQASHYIRQTTGRSDRQAGDVRKVG